MVDFTDEKRNEHYRELFHAAMNAGDVNRVREICNEWGIDNTETLVSALEDDLRWRRFRRFWQAQEKQESIAEVMYLLDRLIRIANHQKLTLRRYHWN